MTHFCTSAPVARFGRKEAESAKKNTEVDALYKLVPRAWALYKARELMAESAVTGAFVSTANTAVLLDVIEDSREEDLRHEIGRAR